MGITEEINKCIKLDNFESLKIGDYVRYISFDSNKQEWNYKEGGYFKKWGINVKDIPYIVVYNFNTKRTNVFTQWWNMPNGEKKETLFFYDPHIEPREPPIPKYIQRNQRLLNDEIYENHKDSALLTLHETVKEMETEITYLRNKLKMFEKENKVLRTALKQRSFK